MLPVRKARQNLTNDYWSSLALGNSDSECSDFKSKCLAINVDSFTQDLGNEDTSNIAHVQM
jgi:hypothetical protein